MAAISEYKNTAVGDAQIAPPGANLALDTTTDSKPVRINSRSYTQTSGSTIGMQVKPNQSVATTGDVIGAEISPRIASGLGCGALIGAVFEPILKGTSLAGTVSEVRGVHVALTDENIAGRTITNDIVAMRVYMQLAAHTVSGDVAVLKVGANAGAQQWDYLMKLGECSIANAIGAPGGAQAGFIKVKVGGAVRYIQLHNTA
jgi:hypothetical protein